MNKINCPQCNAKIIQQDSALIHCQFCSSSFLVEDSIETQKPLIILNQAFLLRGIKYTTLSFSQNKHENGTRTDWLIEDDKSQQFILIVDDEDIALLPKNTTELSQRFIWSRLLANTQLELFTTPWLVTQQKLFDNGLKQTYLGNENAELLLLTFNNSSISYQKGHWLDAFEVKYAD
jgi:DNA-directed RNA polymerase subunit RPC12/RpoP